MKIVFWVGAVRISITPLLLTMKQDGVVKRFGWEAALDSIFKTEMSEAWVPFAQKNDVNPERVGTPPPLDTQVWVFETYYDGVTIGVLESHPNIPAGETDPLWGAMWRVIRAHGRRAGQWSNDCGVSAWAPISYPAPPLFETKKGKRR
jgi:hypothetical protein